MANFIAIDLDSQGLYAVAGSARGASKVTHALAWTGDDPPPPLTADTAKQIGEKLRDRLKAAGVPQAPVLVTVGRDRVILKELRYPPVPPADEAALVHFQAMKEMSESPNEIVIDYAPFGEVGGERRAMAVVVRKDLFGAIQAMCAAANLKLAGVTPRPYAVAAGLLRSQAGGTAPGGGDDAVVALTLGTGGGEFTVVRRGAVVFTLALPAPVIASEAMLVAQVRRNLAVYAGQNPDGPVQAVYVAEVDGSVVGRLETALGVPVHAYDPLAGSVPAVPANLRGRFAGAAGLLAGRAANSLPINFAAPRQPVTDKDPAKRKIAMLALAAMILLMIGAAGGYFMVSAADAEVADLTAQRDKLKESAGGGGPDAARLKGLDGWAKREVVWLDELHDLADRMPIDDGVRVTSFSGTPIAPGKDGKQPAQAKLELKLASTGTGPATALMSAFERDNNGVNRFYLGTNEVNGGLLPGGASRHNQQVTLFTNVVRRDPDKYTRSPRFVPPKRMAGGVGSPPPEPAAPVATEAPAPREKTTEVPPDVFPDDM